MSLLTIFVPPEFHGTVFEEVAMVNGNRIPTKYDQRDYNGHAVISIPLSFFHRVIAGPQGKRWVEENPEVMAWLGEADRRDMFCDAFPGEHRAPAAPYAPVTTVMVRMLAPKDLSSVCIAGVDLPINEDRSVTVTEADAETLRSHGFSDAA